MNADIIHTAVGMGRRSHIYAQLKFLIVNCDPELLDQGRCRHSAPASPLLELGENHNSCPCLLRHHQDTSLLWASILGNAWEPQVLPVRKQNSASAKSLSSSEQTKLSQQSVRVSLTNTSTSSIQHYRRSASPHRFLSKRKNPRPSVPPHWHPWSRI